MSNPLPDSSELSGVLFAAPYQCKDSDLSRNGRESLKLYSQSELKQVDFTRKLY